MMPFFEGELPPFAFVIDTDEYAGNFERPLVAYMTGQIGECEVGEECVGRYKDQVTEKQTKQDDRLVRSAPDDHGCHRPASIYPNPLWWNDGRGNHYEHAKRPAPGRHWPAYYSVAVWLNGQPPADVLARWFARARTFAQDPQACGCHEFVPKFNVTGARLVAQRLDVTTIEALPAE